MTGPRRWLEAIWWHASRYCICTVWGGHQGFGVGRSCWELRHMGRQDLIYQSFVKVQKFPCVPSVRCGASQTPAARLQSTHSVLRSLSSTGTNPSPKPKSRIPPWVPPPPPPLPEAPCPTRPSSRPHRKGAPTRPRWRGSTSRTTWTMCSPPCHLRPPPLRRPPCQARPI